MSKLIAAVLILLSHATVVLAFDFSKLGICKDDNGTFRLIKRLQCQSNRATLTAANPQLEIPICDENNPSPKVISGHHPVSAIFVSCNTSNLESCLNISRSVLENKTGATLNILISNSLLNSENFQHRFADLWNISQQSHSPLNILPVNSEQPTNFIRDPGIFRSDGKRVKYTALPGKNAFSSMNEMVKSCSGFVITRSYAELAEFDTAYAYFAKQASDSIAEQLADSRLIGASFGRNEQMNQSSGGNFIALPNETLIVGKTSTSAPSAKVLSYFKKRQKVLEIEIPDLSVGHIDEVLKIVPSKDACGFSIVRASPYKMKKFLERQPPDLAIIKVSTPPERKSAIREHNLMSEIRVLKEQIEELKKNNNDVPQAFQEKMLILATELKDYTSYSKNLTVKDILRDESLMLKWQEDEETIQKAVGTVLAEFKSCVPKIIDLPVFWNKDGEALIANPVNALAANGNYFYSAPDRRLRGDWKLNKYAWFEEDDHYEAFDTLRSEIEKTIIDQTGLTPQLVKTPSYDVRGGNFHCATTNIYVPCMD